MPFLKAWFANTCVLESATFVLGERVLLLSQRSIAERSYE